MELGDIPFFQTKPNMGISLCYHPEVMGHDSWSTSTLLLELEPRFTLEVYQSWVDIIRKIKGAKKLSFKTIVNPLCEVTI